MCAILQLVSAPLNPRPIVDILGRATHYVSTVTEQTKQHTKGKQNWKLLNETVYDATKQNSGYTARAKNRK